MKTDVLFGERSVMIEAYLPKVIYAVVVYAFDGLTHHLARVILDELCAHQVGPRIKWLGCMRRKSEYAGALYHRRLGGRRGVQEKRGALSSLDKILGPAVGPLFLKLLEHLR